LLALTAEGASVPPGFILIADPAAPVLKRALEVLGRAAGTAFGDAAKPLLVAVRSSPPETMPKTQGAVFNLGLTEATIPAYLQHLGGGEKAAALAWDAYRRLLLSYGLNVLRVDPEALDLLRSEALDTAKVDAEHELDAKALEALTRAIHAEIQKAGPLPATPFDWLAHTIRAGFAAWDDPEAEERRRTLAQRHVGGTTMIVQAMVHGTGGAPDGAGHLHTRHPSTGEKTLHGSYLAQAEGSDLTAGVRIPESLTALAKRLPELHQQIGEWGAKLERRLGDAVELDFTVAGGELYVLGATPARRTPAPA
jgi:pyruvate,orthophosphate dikinase